MSRRTYAIQRTLRAHGDLPERVEVKTFAHDSDRDAFLSKQYGPEWSASVAGLARGIHTIRGVSR
jgi:hypothetical protein